MNKRYHCPFVETCSELEAYKAFSPLDKKYPIREDNGSFRCIAISVKGPDKKFGGCSYISLLNKK